MSRVCQLDGSLNYYVYAKPCDMRKSFNGLQGIVASEFGKCVSSTDVFIFMGKSRNTAKMLRREANGMTLYARKLSGGRFQLPKYDDETGKYEVDYNQFSLLMLGEKWVKE